MDSKLKTQSPKSKVKHTHLQDAGKHFNIVISIPTLRPKESLVLKIMRAQGRFVPRMGKIASFQRPAKILEFGI
jgi:hypothetical protein